MHVRHCPLKVEEIRNAFKTNKRLHSAIKVVWLSSIKAVLCVLLTALLHSALKELLSTKQESMFLSV